MYLESQLRSHAEDKPRDGGLAGTGPVVNVAASSSRMAAQGGLAPQIGATQAHFCEMPITFAGLETSFGKPGQTSRT